MSALSSESIIKFWIKCTSISVAFIRLLNQMPDLFFPCKYVWSETRIIHNKFVDILCLKDLLNIRTFDFQTAIFNRWIKMKSAIVTMVYNYVQIQICQILLSNEWYCSGKFRIMSEFIVHTVCHDSSVVLFLDLVLPCACHFCMRKR